MFSSGVLQQSIPPPQEEEILAGIQRWLFGPAQLRPFEPAQQVAQAYQCIGKPDEKIVITFDQQHWVSVYGEECGVLQGCLALKTSTKFACLHVADNPWLNRMQDSPHELPDAETCADLK